MPRVITRTKNKGGTKTYTCTGCRKPIEPGQQFYKWSRRFGRTGMTYYRHVECGYPRPTELSSRKTAQIEEAIGEVDVDSWAPEMGDLDATEEDHSVELDLSDLEAMLEDVATVAEEVGGEYEEGADNMPESLQWGSQAEAMRDVAQRLEDWADNIRDFASSATTTVDLPSLDDHDGDEDAWREACEAAFDEAVEEAKNAARTALEDMPEYEG